MRLFCLGFYVYDSNRMQKIWKFTHPKPWRYIPNLQNPADVPTWPVRACHLIETKWLTGPSFWKIPASIPVKQALYSLIDTDLDLEVWAHATTYLNPDSGFGSHHFKRFLSYKWKVTLQLVPLQAFMHTDVYRGKAEK